MRVTIDEERCQGHGRCVLLCPEVFDADEIGHGVVKEPSIGTDLVAAVGRAVQNCPERAITVEP